MLYSPKSIANYFLDLAKASGETLDPMKLQKLVYYAHGWYAGYTGRPLIDESVEAWPYGPVVPSLYHEFKRFGSGSIAAKARDFVGFQHQEVPPPDDSGIRKFLENVWATYGRLTGIRLSEMTHASGSPWDQTRQEFPGVRSVDIPFERIVAHFKDAAEKAKQRSAQS